MSGIDVINNTSSDDRTVHGIQTCVPAATDILFDLKNTRRNFDYEVIREGYRADGYSEELVDRIISALKYRRSDNQ